MASKKLYIGGTRTLDGYIHIRLDKENLQQILNLPYKNCCVEDIIVEKTLEYLPPGMIVDALTEWRRVLSVGGRFVIIYPDAVEAVLYYQRNVLTFEQLQVAIRRSYRTILARNKLESLLLLRYPDVREERVYPFLEKKLWERIFVAFKGRIE